MSIPGTGPQPSYVRQWLGWTSDGALGCRPALPSSTPDPPTGSKHLAGSGCRTHLVQPFWLADEETGVESFKGGLRPAFLIPSRPVSLDCSGPHFPHL